MPSKNSVTSAPALSAIGGPGSRYIRGSSYMVVNGVTAIWRASGTFTLKTSNSSFNIIRDDGVVINVNQLRNV